MPHGARTNLAALMLILGLGGASAEPAQGTTWTDPPTHKPAAGKPPADRNAPAAAATTPAAAKSAAKSAATSAATSAPTPAAISRTAQPAPAERRAARRAPVRQAAHKSPPTSARATKRLAATARPARAAASVRAIRDPQFVAAAPPRPPAEAYARYRAYGYGPGSGYMPGYMPGYTDERLDRLSSAQAAGYLVVRRRTVQFPDGRTLRVYRPDDGGEPY